jgi:hypothetical protein
MATDGLIGMNSNIVRGAEVFGRASQREIKYNHLAPNLLIFTVLTMTRALQQMRREDYAIGLKALVIQGLFNAARPSLLHVEKRIPRKEIL